VNRIDRLTAILIQLQSQRVVKAREIAARFDISLRTVYRDINALEEAGVPIGAEAGIGYYLMKGYHLPPVMFTKEEASALAMAGKLFEKYSDKSIKGSHESALYKIKAILDTEDKRHLEGLHEKITVFGNPVANREEDNHYLVDLQHALANNLLITMDYFSPYENKTSSRTIEPVGLVFYADHWHMIAFCLLRQDYRDFRIDRITKLKVEKEGFPKRFYGSIEELKDKIATTQALEKVSITFTKEISLYIKKVRYYYGFVEEKELEDGVEMHFLVYSMEIFAAWVVSFAKYVTINEPPSLREAVLKHIKELNEHYKV